jgi:hypothetical protein
VRRAAPAAMLAALLAAALAAAGIDLLSLPRHHDRLTDALVGDAAGRRFDGALVLFAAAERPGAPPARRARAEAALAGQGGGSALRSRAQTLLGVLAVRDAQDRPARARPALEAARAAFRRAVILDPANEDAAADLELLDAARGRGERRPGPASGGRTAGTGSTTPSGNLGVGVGASSGGGSGF